MRSLWSRGVFFQYENGTTGIKNFGFQEFCTNHQIIIPLMPDLERFSARVERSYDFGQALAEQSRVLAALRDALLPALMSGRLRVKDAERQVEEVL